MEQELYKWRAVSRPYQPLSKAVFTTAIVIMVLVGVVLLLAGEWGLIAVMVAGTFAYYMWSTVPPEEIDHVLTSRGVRVGTQLTTWDNLTRWWTETRFGHRLLNVETLLSWPRRLHLVLPSTDEAKILQIMGEKLLQEKPAETGLDRAGKWLVEKFPLETK